MVAEQIIKSACRNLGILSTNNETVIEGIITQKGLLDELNRIYTNQVCQFLMSKSRDEFVVEARHPTYRQDFIVQSVDLGSKTLVASTGVFGTADLDFFIYNSVTKTQVKIKSYINSQTIEYDGVLDSTWTNDLCYILSNIIILDGDISSYRDIIKVEIKRSSVDTLLDAKHETVRNQKVMTAPFNYTNVLYPVYSLTSIPFNNVVKSCLVYAPTPIDITGEVRINYIAQPEALQMSDTPRFDNMGVSDILINGLTAWGWKVLGDFGKASAYEENNSFLGGIVPKGFTFFNKRYTNSSNQPIKFKPFW